jgi:hypothetical protein
MSAETGIFTDGLPALPQYLQKNDWLSHDHIIIPLTSIFFTYQPAVPVVKQFIEQHDVKPNILMATQFLTNWVTISF